MFGRRRRRIPADPADLEHFRRWAETRVGIEAFLEPETLVSVPGLCLVAFDGEWTRRPVGDVATARTLNRGTESEQRYVERVAVPEAADRTPVLQAGTAVWPMAAPRNRRAACEVLL